MSHHSPKILAIDQGTTSSRALIFNKKGHVIAKAQQEFRQYFPHDGWVEHDPEEIWSTTLACVQKVLKEQPDIKAIGITNQRETIIIWDKNTGKAIYPAIVWQDRRTSDFCAQQKKDGLESYLTSKTGLLIDPYFSASKIKWILDNVDSARDRANKGELLCGTIDCFLLWRLTNGQSHLTDVTNASRTNLFNIHTSEWDQDLLKLFQIPAQLLPKVQPNASFFGEANSSILGTNTSIPILAMAGDQQSATIGQACFQEGMIKSTYGTGCFALMNCGSTVPVSKNRLLATVAYEIGNARHYALEGSIFNAGSVVKWLRDQLGLIQTAAESEAYCQKLLTNEGVYFVPAFTGLGAPYWNPDVRGLLMGLTRDSKKEHIVRAALESVVYQSLDLFKAMSNDANEPIASMRVDGGMVQNKWFLQFLADMIGIKIERPKILEITALGVAFTAGLQDGIYSSLDAISTLWTEEIHFLPHMPAEKKNHFYEGWQRAVHATLNA
ncbi:MAG: glycerol kinase GlpK [Alphaproteobacteria bacterium]|jgi:glycerol kinase|nr:glycerol kinase GlpK [Alphaproteobacteria bacterium]MBP9877645.1 glycerol kinase GlpK [Alphaproteobacteria bacterium]